MPTSLSFASPSSSWSFLAIHRGAPAVVALPIRLSNVFADAWRRRADRRMELLLARLDHAGLIEDFRRARRG